MALTRQVIIPEFDLYLFARGEHWDLYRVLGAHPHELDGENGYRFAVWAPNAQEIHIVGEFNDWRWGEYPLYPVASTGIWACFVPGMQQGTLYKLGIKDHSGRIVYKTDPYALYAEKRPSNAAKAWTLDGYDWNDEEWMRKRREQGLPLHRAVSIYEIHPGSWRRKDDGGFLTYNELADQLIPYVKELGFTHIQLMPIAEHPLDESWGYQTSHYFAPTARFGAPDDFRNFVDRCHGADVGVLLDWVPGHFPRDEWSLGRFDGTGLYEHADPRQGEHPDWGTYIFNYGRNEVRNFLLANALYWLKEFHIDGIRIDAVASMLYLDYSREHGEWVPNVYGGRENLEAIEFLKELNRVVHEHYPGAIMVAEESTSWPGVSRPLYVGGLGFTFKWNMGWMHDTLEYFAKEPIHRAHHQNTLTFSMLYAFTENFVLPLSHDEVVHGKGALLSKMPGDMWQQQANLRLLFAYQWAHPGKKLLFMGGEFGQWNEWKESGQLDWVLLEFPSHQGLTRCLADLNRMLRDEPALHRFDHEWHGFEWLDFSDYANSVLSFLRRAPEWRPSEEADEVIPAAPSIIWIFNFTPVVRENYVIPAPHGGLWREIFNSDSAVYGGSNVGNAGQVEARHIGEGWGLSLTLPPLAAMAFKPVNAW